MDHITHGISNTALHLALHFMESKVAYNKVRNLEVD